MKTKMNYDWSDKRVLIVDDTYLNCLLLKTILEHTKIDITIARNSKDFFHHIVNKFDLVLMDINLGENINGIDLIKHMQTHGDDTPIIIQTAYGNEYFISDDIDYIDMIRKPINAQKLYVMMNAVLNGIIL